MESFDLVVFGGDGDLAYRKIYPALYHRLNEGQISAEDRILAVSRRQLGQEAFESKFTDELHKHVPEANPDTVKSLMNMISSGVVNVTQDFIDDDTKDWFSDTSRPVRVFYLATPATAFGGICAFLSKHDLLRTEDRVVLEKPLGSDLKSSEAINDEVAQYFDESQIYRIDHYLGKETVQNLMVLRFANNIFENSWNYQNIDNVQITVAESIGVGTRGAFYNEYGALRDMVQNHLLQLLCLIAMEPPARLEADEVRDEKLKVLKSLRFYNEQSIQSDTVRGQYTRGNTEEGQLPSYLEDIEMYESKTETFVALKTYIDNWRWRGVPFYLRTGKRMPVRYSEIVINFKPVPHNLFSSKKVMEHNRLTIRLQPEERIELRQMVKVPGPGGYRYKPVALELDYADHFNDRFPEAYERLLMDVIRGNQTLFMHREEVKASWRWAESILDNWKAKKVANLLYEAGTWGPGQNVLPDELEWVKPRHEMSNSKLHIVRKGA